MKVKLLNAYGDSICFKHAVLEALAGQIILLETDEAAAYTLLDKRKPCPACENDN